MAVGQNLSGFNPTEEQKKKEQTQYAAGRQSSLAPVADKAVQQGKDALRMMNPFRDAGAPVTPASPAQPAPQQNTVARNLLNSPQQQQQAQTRQTYPLVGGQSSISLNENAQPNSLARTAAPLSQPPAQPLKATLAGGINYEGDLQGNRTFSMGTPGQDGYGRMSVRSGTGVQPANQLARQALVGQPQQIGGLSVTGPQDAVNRLAAPVGTVNRNTPEYQRWEAENKLKANPSYGGKSIEGNSDMPLAHPAPAAPVGGWQTRLAVYKEQMGAADAASRLAAQSASQNAQERGANYRAGLQFKSQQNENDIARQRLMGEQGFNDARIKTEGINQQKGQMEVDQARKMQALNDQYLAEQDPVKQKNLGNQILTMQGKNSKDWQITTREEPLDPSNPMAGTTKRPYAVNLNDPNQVIELGGQGGGGPQPLPEASKRVKGQLYTSPATGQVAMWDGNGLILQK